MNSCNTALVEPNTRPPAEGRTSPRVDEFGRLRSETEAAIDQLVTALLQERQDRHRGLAEVAHGLEGFGTAFEQFVRRLDIDRTNDDLAHASRHFTKTATLTFVGGHNFGCNIKYAWLEACQQAEQRGWQVWFLPQDESQERLARQTGAHVFPVRQEDWTADHVRQALCTAVVVLGDHFLHQSAHAAALLAGARQVQLWHGVSIKEMGLQDLPGGRGLTRHRARTLATSGPFNRFLGTAASAEAEWRRWFAFDHYVPLGYPRNDPLYRELTAADLAGCDARTHAAMQAARKAGRRTVLYAPTFRDADPRWMFRVGLPQVAQAVHHAGDLFVVQLHPRDFAQADELARLLPGAIVALPKTDVVPLLREASVLVTDYSSVMFDYLHLGRPIVWYRPDHAEYVTHCRELWDAKLAERPGPMLTQPADLAAALCMPSLAQEPEHAAARQRLLHTLFDHRDGGSAARLMAALDEEVRAAVPRRPSS